jgi:HD superfamily phosphodiesterase
MDIKSLWETLALFVKNICKDRDESHGYDHMEKVAITSIDIFIGEKDKIPLKYHPDIIEKIIIVSWLHDIADYKYDRGNTLKRKMEEFIMLIVMNKEKCKQLMKIIDLISYSKENNAKKIGMPIDFEDALGKYDAYVRHIVSDADKLEALGKIGFDRCMEYSVHSYMEKYKLKPSKYILNKMVVDHANEKLLKLKDHFIRTETGKLMALPLHNELLDEINKLNM